MHRTISTIAAAALLVAGCGNNGVGTDGLTTNYNSATGTMTASVDGASWTANFYTRAVLSNGVLSVTGESFTGNTATERVITMAAANVTAPGSFTLGPAGDGHGGNALMTYGTSVYSSVTTGGSGTLIVTAYNATHITGTFSFVGVISGTGTSTVTSGSFDIPF